MRMLKPQLAVLDTSCAKPATTKALKRTAGKAWMTHRERILRRDHGRCQCAECKAKGRILIATEVDHRVPLWEGGSDDDSNLQAINADCHKRKTAEEAQRRAGGGRISGGVEGETARSGARGFFSRPAEIPG